METLPHTPVPRRHRENGWTPARQWAFIQALEASGSVADAAARAGMSAGSAYRLRRHPEAEEFRRAWAAAQARLWQRVEQVALDRVVNGDLEVIERDGAIVATRRKPCSDRLMIFMLQEQLRKLADANAVLAAANATAARTARAGEWPLVNGARVAPPVPEPIDAARAETIALREHHAMAETLPDSTDWDLPIGQVSLFLDGAVPPLPMPEKTLVPACGHIALRLRPPRLGNGLPGNGRPSTGLPARKVRKTPPGPDLRNAAHAPPMDYLDRFNPCKQAIAPNSTPDPTPAGVQTWD
jgi:hypothetical protein